MRNKAEKKGPIKGTTMVNNALSVFFGGVFFCFRDLFRAFLGSKGHKRKKRSMLPI